MHLPERRHCGVQMRLASDRRNGFARSLVLCYRVESFYDPSKSLSWPGRATVRTEENA